MSLGGSNKLAIVVAALLIILLTVDGFLAYRYYNTVLSGEAGQRTESAFEQTESAFEQTESAFEQTEQTATPGDTTVESGIENESSFVQRAEQQNISDNSTYIDSPRTNGDPDAILLVQSPRSGDAGDYAHSIGVWYDASLEQWAVFNQDLAPMEEGAAFDMILAETSSEDSGAAGGYESVFVHQAAPANITGNVTYIDDPSINGDPDAALSITPNWNPGGGGGNYNDHPVDVRYDPGSEGWIILNEDNAQMPNGAAFNVVVS